MSEGTKRWWVRFEGSPGSTEVLIEATTPKRAARRWVSGRTLAELEEARAAAPGSMTIQVCPREGGRIRFFLVKVTVELEEIGGG